jgi:alpha-L-fucosidase
VPLRFQNLTLCACSINLRRDAKNFTPHHKGKVMFKPAPTAGDTSWFVHDRFGMFIHWGLYASPSRHEWVQSHEKIAPDDYRKYFEVFDPDLYDPKAWARAAREAGMKYFVITTKHHEGFCLWDTQFTDYKVTNTPGGRDLLTPLVEAMRAEGLKVGFYYSLIDWHHPDFTIDVFHPLRDHPDAAKLNEGRDMTRYAEYMRNQVRELLTNFGKIDVLWFDFSYSKNQYKGLPGKGHNDWQSRQMVDLVRELQPHVIIDNRLDLADHDAADIHTPEQWQPTEWVKFKGEPVVWEACQTFSGSWGYHRDETTWKSPEQLVQMLINTVSCGGNLLMNVGPTARGTFDQRALDALQVYAEWMRLHERSIRGCTQSEFQAPTDVRYTQNFETNRLYVHLYAYPFKHLHLPGLQGKVKYAQFLNDASEIKLNLKDWTSHEATKGKENVLTMELPINKPNTVVPVIELFLK